MRDASGPSSVGRTSVAADEGQPGGASWDLLCIMGPTASGKTRYAVSLARELNRRLPTGCHCEIISADSRQVYRRMDIGTGKDKEEYGEIPVHLLDIAEPGTEYNVYEYQRDFAQAYRDICARGCLPILCGGSGLYIEAVTCSYDFGKNIGTDEAGSPGKKAPSVMGLPRHTYYIGTLVTREERRARIARRLDERLANGMVEEIRSLLEEGVPSETLIRYGLEYRFVTQYLLGEITYEFMRERLYIAICQFAKRQMTWLRGMEKDGIVIHWTQV
ncbi:MAG: tRNA (adenosine(37)-N6)-dimethylallyltransferase MiaA [Bacteroidales bacterium]|nr:tRNA (adenosine(37)-N6)-dimethylallyltransferase MiaA [Bacteroidales bacterium]